MKEDAFISRFVKIPHGWMLFISDSGILLISLSPKKEQRKLESI